MDGHHPPVWPGTPHVIDVGDETAPQSLATVTAGLLDDGTETIVQWRVPCGQSFRNEPAFIIAQSGSMLLMRKRAERTVFTIALPFDGFFRFANTPTLFDWPVSA